MKNTQIKLRRWASATLLAIFFISHAAAEETIIQQEKIPFEKCLKVITTSESKLSLSPKIKDTLDQKRVAVFTLIDGTLTITCNAEENSLTVSTNTD